MSPRSYRLGEREHAVQQTRTRMIDAARSLLTAHDSGTRFTIEAVARAADVSRMTVYYQFESKVGLLEAICDTLAANGGIEQLASIFRLPDAYDALAELIRVFGAFWESDRVLSRRLRALATLDEEFAQVIRARDERRRRGLRILTQRLAEQTGKPNTATFDATVELLFALTSFEMFDMLAGTEHSCTDMVPTVERVVRAALASSALSAQGVGDGE